MKKILFVFMILLFTGCTELSNTPTKRVEEFLKNYQTLDNQVVLNLDDVVNQDVTLNDEQKTKYRDIMKKHYQNLTYEVKDEMVDGDNARVTVELTVTDFSKVLRDSETYMNNNMDEFYDETGNYNMIKYNDYRLEQMDKTNEKVKYTVYFNLTKQNDEWKMSQMDSVTYDKINGVYNY